LKSIAIIAIVVIFLFVPISAYATHAYDEDYSNDPEYEGKTQLRYYLIYASYYRECNFLDEKKIEFFKHVSSQYLRLIGFLPIISNPYECVNVTGNYEKTYGDPTQGLTLNDAIKKAEAWHFDLLVIVLDTPLSYLSYLNTYEDGSFTLGHYYPAEKDGVRYIVTSTPLEEIEGVKGAWTLSHELAHFGYHELGMPASVWAGDDVTWNGAPKSYIHQMDDIYDKCVLNHFSSDNCSDSYVLMSTRESGYVKVLKPYEPTIYSETTCSTGTVLKNGICVVKEQPTPILKDYDGDGYSDMNDSCPTQRENFNGYQDSDGCPDNPSQINPPTRKDESITLLGLSHTINGQKDTMNVFEGDVLCLEYSLRDYHDRSFNSWFPVADKTISVKRQVIDGNGNSIGVEESFYYTTDSSGNVNICTELELSLANYWKMGYQYSAFFAGDTIFNKSDGPIATIYFEEKPIENDYKNKLQKENELESKKIEEQKILDEWMINQERSKNEQESQYTIDKAIETSKNLEQDYQKQTREKSKNDEKESAFELKNNIHKKLDELKNRFSIARTSLESVSVESSDAKEKINQARILLRVNWEMNDDFEERVQRGDRQMNFNEYANAKTWYANNEKSIQESESVLKQISTLIEEAQKADQKTCFLFWCW